VRSALIIPDCHIPYENKQAYDLMLNVAYDIQPDEIVILGDFADFYWASSHGKHPDMLSTFQHEIDEVNYRLDELDFLFPDSKKRFLQGNHEYRLERYLQDKAPDFFGYVNCEELFHLSERPNWSWHKYGPNQAIQVLGSKLYARHEPLGSSAKATANKAMCSLV